MTEKADPAAKASRRTGHDQRTPIAQVFVCPKCQGAMRTYDRSGLVVELCEDCRGMFLDRGELERLIDTEGGGWSGILAEPFDPAT